MVVKVKYLKSVVTSDFLKSENMEAIIDGVFYCDYNKSNKCVVIQTEHNVLCYDRVTSLDVLSPILLKQK